VAWPDRARNNPARSGGRLRPINALGPIAGCVFTLLAWAAVAHNSGSGWVQALGAVLGAVLLVGIVGPSWFVAHAVVDVEAAPSDAMVGEPLELTLVSNGRVRVRSVAPLGEATFVGSVAQARNVPARLFEPGEIAGGHDEGATLTIVPDHRGILIALTVEISSAAPFGILWWSRRTTLALPEEISVAPRPTDPLPAPPERDDTRGDSQSRRAATFGETRGVRQYEHGDARKTVHWRASAHTGRLMVREMEEPTAEPITVRVVLPSDEVEAENLAGRALATLFMLLERSRPVVLATHETGRDRVALVSGRRDAGRRLARAVAFGATPGSLTIEESQSNRQEQ